ncbi:hypothetical protein NHX12_013714 [Muraenolepis orangiensis]|uniref:C-type lectin domain-containing protein n=1 Tax=Muraenolepis orangiensis TaxID=630683 RepID=A0A9Q0DAU0_9TELE|nr:hypothetical protein NHX12_013714 [Muraenolepis orangiensis]
MLCAVSSIQVMKTLFRIKLSSADINPNDPEVSEAILKQWVKGACYTFYFFQVCVCAALHDYLFVDMAMTWMDAQRYCREKHLDLATVDSPDDQHRLVHAAGGRSPAWIGLYDDFGSWKWSLWDHANYSDIPVMKTLFRIKLSSADIDPNDPEVSEAILKQLQGKLMKEMVNKNFSLRWTKARDGEIFHNTRKDQTIEALPDGDTECDLTIKHSSLND